MTRAPDDEGFFPGRRGGGVARVRVATVLLGASLAILAILGVLAWRHRGEVVQALGTVAPSALVLAVLFVLLGYLLRLCKWLWLLHRLGVRAPAGEASLLFGAGLLLILTPAKLGELWKAWALAERRGLRPETVLPAVVMERVLDMAAVAGLAVLSATLLGFAGGAIILLAVAVVAGLVLLTRPKFWAAVARLAGRRARLGDAVRELGDGLGRLAKPLTLAVALGFALCAWALEGAAVKLILDGLGFQISWTFGIWVFTIGTLAGVASVLPGGLGAAEAGMVGILLAAGADSGTAGAATVLVRLATLGLGAAIGLLTLPVWLAVKRTAPTPIQAEAAPAAVEPPVPPT